MQSNEFPMFEVPADAKPITIELVKEHRDEN